jgi:hypothetical protein
MFTTIDVLPMGILMNCAKMEDKEVRKIISSASPTYKLTEVELVAFGDKEDTQDRSEKTDILITIKEYAENHGNDYLWSAQIRNPMIKIPIEKAPYFVTMPASSILIDKVYHLFGTPHYRSCIYGTDNSYYMDEDGTKGAKKGVHTAFFTAKPTQDVPPFYTLRDKQGVAIGLFAIETRCFNVDVLNMCDICRFDLLSEGEHKCLRVGTFIPSKRKKVEKQKYKQKRRNLRDLMAEEYKESVKRAREQSPAKSGAKPKTAQDSDEEGATLEMAQIYTEKELEEMVQHASIHSPTTGEEQEEQQEQEEQVEMEEEDEEVSETDLLG